MTNEHDKSKPRDAVPLSTSRLPGERRITNAPPPLSTLSGGDFHPPSTDFAFWALRAGKPDWSHWSNMAIVDFDDACYLSFNIDPAGARKCYNAAQKFSAVSSRHQIAENHLGAGLPSYETDSDRYYIRLPSGVKLFEFRAWGESLPTPFTFPDEFPKAAIPELIAPAASVANEPAKEKALKTRERNNLLRIIRALDAMNPRPLPQTGYAESIRAKLDELGLPSVSDDTIRRVIEDARKLDC